MEAQFQSALAALQDHRSNVMQQKAKKKKGNLLQAPTTVQMLVQFADNQKLPERIATHTVQLPKPMFSLENTDTCLITRPPQRKIKDALQKANFPHRIERVIDIRKLRRKFKSYADREKLHKSYTLFLADSAISDSLSETLGRDFVFKAKHPVPVYLPANKPEELQKSLQKAMASAMFNVKKKSLETTCGIGNTDQEASDLSKNAMAVVEYLKSKPEFADNIYSIRIKTQRSPALLVFQNQNIEQRGKGKRTREETEEATPAPVKQEEAPAPKRQKVQPKTATPAAAPTPAAAKKETPAATPTPAAKKAPTKAATPAAQATPVKEDKPAAKPAGKSAPARSSSAVTSPTKPAFRPAGGRGAGSTKVAGKVGKR